MTSIRTSFCERQIINSARQSLILLGSKEGYLEVTFFKTRLASVLLPRDYKHLPTLYNASPARG